MNVLYIDCTSGVSGDMLLKALTELGGSAPEREAFDPTQSPEERPCGHGGKNARDHHESHESHSHEETPYGRHHAHDHEHAHCHEHEHKHHHAHTHRSHKEVQAIIQNSPMPPKARETALSIYRVIAQAEAKVHNSDAENVRFHEVGRNEAIKNITGIAAALDSLNVEAVYCSKIHDGTGFITCSHGKIPVPVPAVMAMREACDYPFVTEDVETELVTPSGLGVLIGIGARYAEKAPEGKLLKTVTAKGCRDTGKEGLKASLIQRP